MQKNNNYNYIFITADKGFIDNYQICKDEFHGYSSQEIYIFLEMSNVKELLDEKFNLNLDLKKLYNSVEQKLTLKIGTLIHKSVQFYKSNRLSYLGIGLDGDENFDLNKYDCDDYSFADINQINDKLFQVKLLLSFEKPDQNTLENVYPRSHKIDLSVYRFSDNLKSNYRTLEVLLRVNIDDIDNFRIISADRYSPYKAVLDKGLLGLS